MTVSLITDSHIMVAEEEPPTSTPTDVHVLTSGGLHIPAHSSALASVSTVLERLLLDGPKNNKKMIIKILGVPCDAVVSFIQYLYTSRCRRGEEMEKYGIHLLTLSHVYLVPQLKQKCSKEVGGRLTVDSVVDLLQLARLCDAPDLYLKCMKMISTNFKSVEMTEGWKFLQDNDPFLELEILKFLDENETRQRWRKKMREEQNLYVQLSEAMECLEHICTEGCTSVGPCDSEPIKYNKKKGPCSKFATCQGLQLLIKHFATCKKKKRVNGGCVRCKRMWQLLRLHSSICNHHDSDHCPVPLCRQFNLRTQQGRKENDARWRLLVRKVVCAKVMCSLSLTNTKGEDQYNNTSTVDAGVKGLRQ